MPPPPRMSAVKKPCRVFAPQKLEVQKLALTPIFEPHPVPIDEKRPNSALMKLNLLFPDIKLTDNLSKRGRIYG